MDQQTNDYSLGDFSISEGGGRRPKHQCRENGHARKLQRYRTQRLMTRLHRDSHDPECHASSERLSQLAVVERPSLHKSLISQVPLRLQIKVNGQRGGLGICIAGGKGSLPYKENDEGIFISRVSKGGPAEKAGVHVGDRVLEVNGQDMQEVSHHESVSALRNAGSCIKMKVLRERCVSVEPQAQERPDTTDMDPQLSQVWGRSNTSQYSTDKMLDNRIEATVCNGNRTNDLAEELRPVKETETFKINALQVVKNTMTIPRIILTHPSTSDEDVEPLTLGPDDGDFYDLSGSDSHIYSDCLNSAFYPV